jgi:hypothetical protein
MKPLYETFQDAAAQPSLDEALFIVMERIGVETGDNASIFFSGKEELDDDAHWQAMETLDKVIILTDYVKYEMDYIGMFWEG